VYPAIAVCLTSLMECVMSDGAILPGETYILLMWYGLMDQAFCHQGGAYWESHAEHSKGK
jgi:hypothetical protein